MKNAYRGFDLTQASRDWWATKQSKDGLVEIGPFTTIKAAKAAVDAWITENDR